MALVKYSLLRTMDSTLAKARLLRRVRRGQLIEAGQNNKVKPQHCLDTPTKTTGWAVGNWEVKRELCLTLILGHGRISHLNKL